MENGTDKKLSKDTEILMIKFIKFRLLKLNVKI